MALLIESMSRVNTYYPLHVLINDEVSAASIEILDQLGVTHELVPTIPTPPDIYQHNLNFEPNTAATWRNCWTKFHIFNLTQFDKIVFLDADILILKNLDHLFNCPHMTSCLDGEYFNLWPGWDHFN
ncbi:glycosyltransferase, partial [uncultured Methanobrevibacter sp.]|uniref:glycosyltransferase n=1 Tax=uncultured Methanobrevibacter sp. TaxID=253161 RepID=UPI0025F642FC